MTVLLSLLPVLVAAGAALTWPVREPVDSASEQGHEGGFWSREIDVTGALRRALRWLTSGRRRRRRAAARRMRVLDALAAGLRAGLPVPRAVALAVGDSDSEDDDRAWTGILRAAEEGATLGASWEKAARSNRSSTLAAVARSWRVADRTGAPLADALTLAADSARERLRIERALQAATAGPRATAVLLTLLPLAGVAIAALLGTGPLELYAHPFSVISLALGLVLLLMGHVVVDRMIDTVRRPAPGGGS